jgi:hypothetical protein
MDIDHNTEGGKAEVVKKRARRENVEYVVWLQGFVCSGRQI